MFIRVKTDIMVGNKTVKKGHTAETTKSEGRSLVLRGYADEVESLDDADKPKGDAKTADKWQTVVAKDKDGNPITVDDMTVPKLKKWLDENEVEYKSDLRSDDLKDLVEAELVRLNTDKKQVYLIMITLEQVKKQCRIESDITYEDDLLNGYIASARDHVQMHLDRTIYPDAVPSEDEYSLVDNASIDQAMLLLVAHWYANREAVSETAMSEVPMGVRHLLQPYRRMGV